MFRKNNIETDCLSAVGLEVFHYFTMHRPGPWPAPVNRLEPFYGFFRNIEDEDVVCVGGRPRIKAVSGIYGLVFKGG